MEPVVKKPWQSKTILANLIVAIIAFFPGLEETINPEIVMQALIVINIILRLVTKDKIGLS
jgi:hypothetical protein